MRARGTGTILRVRPISETSVVVHWLTHEHGRIATIAKGARRPKSPFLGRLDLFYTAEFGFSRNPRSDLHILTEVQLKDARTTLRLDLNRLAAASYFVHLIEASTETETPIPEVACLFEGSLLCAQGAALSATAHFGFEIQLMHLLGVLPPAELTGLTLGTRKIWERFLGRPLSDCAGLRLAPAQIRELHTTLGRLIEDQFGWVPKGRPGGGVGEWSVISGQ